MSTKEIRLVLADDHQIVRNGIKQMLESEGSIKVIAEASDGLEAIEMVKEHNPDLIIMDISMPNMTGLEATKVLVDNDPAVKVLVLSMFDREEYVLNAVKYGASGYILKDTDKERFIRAIHKVNNGDKYFSSDVSQVIVNQYLNSVSEPSPVVNSESINDFDLTKRETQILSKIVNGQNNKEVAEELGISTRTIETHRLHIMKKLRVNNAADLVRTALQNKLV